MTAETVLEALEALHSPSRRGHDWYGPVCSGCDSDGWEAEDPTWPCRTAAILWPDPDEQAALLAEWHEWADAAAADYRAKNPATFSLVPGAWASQLMDNLGRSATMMNILRDLP